MKKNIDRQHLLFLIIGTALAFQLFGCNGEKPQTKETAPPKTQVTEEKTGHVKELEAKINDLTAKNKELAKQKAELFEEVKKQEEQKTEMTKRIQKLIDGYEPGIWTTDDAHLFPVFKKVIKSADSKRIIEELNHEFNLEGLPRLIFNKLEKGTVFIRVSDPEQLTQRMGSSGAMSYMATVTYSVTSTEGINCVFFEFEEGDHAIPGQYCRYSFEPFPLQ